MSALLAGVAGGCGDDGGPAAGADAAVGVDADPSTPRWEPRAEVIDGAVQETGVVALGGEVYVLGGFKGFELTDQVAVYDPATDSWRQAAPMPRAVHHVNAAVSGGKIYVAGAMTLSGNSFQPEGFTWVYDPDQNDWTELSPMPSGAERGASFVGAIDGVIYVAGGSDGGAIDLTSAYDIAGDQWTHPLEPLPAARDHGAFAAVDGLLYAIGGRAGSFSNRVDIYHPTTDEWTSGSAMITPRAGVATAVLDGEIVVIGGEDLDAPLPGVFDEVEAYDPSTDSWRALTPMRTPRHGMGAATVDGVIYVPGGGIRKAFGATAIHEAYIPAG